MLFIFVFLYVYFFLFFFLACFIFILGACISCVIEGFRFTFRTSRLWLVVYYCLVFLGFFFGYSSVNIRFIFSCNSIHYYYLPNFFSVLHYNIMGYYLYWLFFIHGFTAFLIDYLLIGTFSYSESSFSYMVFNQNLYLSSFSILFFLLMLLMFIGLFTLCILFFSSERQATLNLGSKRFYSFARVVGCSFSTVVNTVFGTTILSDNSCKLRLSTAKLCKSANLCYTLVNTLANRESLHSEFSNANVRCSHSSSNVLWSIMNNLLFFGFIFDSSSSYSQTFFKYFFLIWNSFFWTKGFIVLLEYWTGLYNSSHKLYHLIYNASSFQFSFIFLFLFMFFISR